MKKYLIGEIKDYTDLCTYKSPFATAMLSRVREAIKGESLRESTYSVTACYFFFFMFITFVYASFVSGHYIFAILGGFTMGLGHLAGHAGNHWAVSESDNFNRAISVSHHCYNYTDRDYIMEQHAPFAYFRIRECDRWRPIHAWQHLIYLTTPFTAFFLGAIRLDCFPYICVSPFLSMLRNNRESPLPAPQFFASGSNALEADLPRDHDGVGPDKFVVFDLD